MIIFLFKTLKNENYLFRYGLIIQNKTTTSNVIQPKTKTLQKPLVKPSIFDDEDEEDVDDGGNTMEKGKTTVKSTHLNINTTENRIKKQTQLEIEKALKEDKNIFEYDEIYDKMEQDKAKLDPKVKNKNESKEVNNILNFNYTIFFASIIKLIN